MSAGFSIHPAIFSPGECEALLIALAATDCGRSRAGIRHLMRVPAIAAFASDPRLIALANAYVGVDPVPFRATLFDKSSQRNWLIAWHQDTALPLAARFERAGWGPWSRKFDVDYAHAPASALSRVIALRIHLDPSTPLNGPLRVIPGSHEAGVLSDETIARRVAEDAANVECTVPQGGVVAMRPLIIHASSKAENTEPRRVLHIEYADSLDLDSGARLAIV